MYVTPEIDAELDSVETYYRGSAEALISVFTAGHLVSVTFTRGVEADLERLDGPDEVWSMCFRHPRPGGRLLGRFLERDTFVGLGLYLREELAGREYEEKAADAVMLWDQRFRARAPLRGDVPADYLSSVVRDLDNDAIF